MHIAINDSPLSSGHSARGVGVYTKLLIESLRKYVPEHSYTLFTRPENIPKDADVVHYPFFDPFFLTLPLRKFRPTVVTVHDLIPLVFPSHFPKGIRGSIKWQIQKMALRGVSHIITDSDTSKNDVAAIVGFPKERIHTVYLAASSAFSKPIPSKTKLHLPKMYVLFVGDVNWNKNVYGLLDVVSSLSVDVVLVGKAFLDMTLPEVQRITSKIATLGLSGRIHMLGYVDEVDLSYLYHNAICTVVPSFYEGFGLPVLESMSWGGIVVAADNSSLHEIKGPAITVNAADSQDICRGITQAISLSSKARQDMIQKGQLWAKQFTWRRVAQETVRVYEQA